MTDSEPVISPPPDADGADPVKVWQAEQDLKIKLAELEIKRREIQRPWYRSPLIIAIAAAAITLLGNIILAALTSSNQLKLEDRKAEGSRVLAALDASDPDQAAENLQLLIDSGLITGELREKIEAYLANRQSGQGAVTGKTASIGPAINCDTAPAGAYEAFDFQLDNGSARFESCFAESEGGLIAVTHVLRNFTDAERTFSIDNADGDTVLNGIVGPNQHRTFQQLGSGPVGKAPGFVLVSPRYDRQPVTLFFFDR